MERLHFLDYEELAYNIADKLDEVIQKDKFNDISIIAKYEEARQVIKELLCIGYDLKSINIHDAEFDGYNIDEYVVSLTNIGDGNEVWCEPMLRENGYITDLSTVTYVFENCSSKVIPYCKGGFVYEVSVGEVCEDDCDLQCQDNNDTSESTYISRKKDGTPTGFQKTWYTEENGKSCYSSYSHYSSDVDLLREIAEKFGVKL